jgi:hypothetical protein
LNKLKKCIAVLKKENVELKRQLEGRYFGITVNTDIVSKEDLRRFRVELQRQMKDRLSDRQRYLEF